MKEIQSKSYFNVHNYFTATIGRRDSVSEVVTQENKLMSRFFRNHTTTSNRSQEQRESTICQQIQSPTTHTLNSLYTFSKYFILEICQKFICTDAIHPSSAQVHVQKQTQSATTTKQFSNFSTQNTVILCASYVRHRKK